MIDRDVHSHSADEVEIIPNRLYWVSCPGVPKSNMRLHYFSVDMRFLYEPFLADFGPLHLGLTIRYCRMMEAMLKDPTLADKRIVHYTCMDPGKRANAAYLVTAYLVIAKRRPAELAFEPFRNYYPHFVPFRDATRGPCPYQMSILDCLRGLETAIQLGWFDWLRFDVEGYEFHQEVENGDMNWIIPDKFLAFAGPCAASTDADGFPAFTPEDYVPIFRSAGIELIVRLNTQQYDRRRFIDNGIKHVDLYFRDGSCPPSDIIHKFLHITEAEPEAVAVHCKAGLGRTGTLIGLYAMKHFQFPARAFIGWNRICRPGSILGPQQQFLCDMQHEMFQAGAALRRPAQMPFSNKELEDARAHMERLTLHRMQAEQHEDVGQGEHLCSSKRGWAGGPGGALGSGPSAPPRGAAGPSSAQTMMQGPSAMMRNGKGVGRGPPSRSLKGIFRAG